MKYKFSVMERLLMSNLLPAEGDIVTLKIVRDLKGELSFTEQEVTELKMKQVDEMVYWDTTNPLVKEIEIGPKGMSLIVDKLEQLENSKKLSMQQLPLYERFVLDNAPSIVKTVKKNER